MPASRRVQELFLDGIEYSVKMAISAYERLSINAATFQPDQEKQEHLFELLFLDAWSVVDCAKRLRAFVDQTPGLKKTPAVRSFLSATDLLPDFRNYYQHLETAAMEVAGTGWPIWGALSWAKVIELKPDGGRLVKSMGIIPGRIATVKGIPLVNPVGKPINPPCDLFVLSLSGGGLHLSELVATIRLFYKRFSIAVQTALETCDKSSDTPIPILLDVT